VLITLTLWAGDLHTTFVALNMWSFPALTAFCLLFLRWRMGLVGRLLARGKERSQLPTDQQHGVARIGNVRAASTGVITSTHRMQASGLRQAVRHEHGSQRRGTSAGHRASH
jgi:hypothetical protein